VPLTHLTLLYADPLIDDLVGCEPLSKLLELNFQRSPLGAARTLTLAGCAHLANLRELSLGGADCRDQGVRAVLRSPHLRNLRRLGLSKNGLSAGFVADLAEADLPHLRALDLSDNPALADASALNALGWLWQLEELSLAGIPLGDERAALFAGSERWVSLRKLDLSRSGLVNDLGVFCLAQSPHLSNLIELRLRGTGGSNHLGNLVTSPHLHRLRVLDLRDSSCPTGGWVRKFADSPMADSLRELRLPPLPQTPGEELLKIERLRGLQVLDLHGFNGGGFDLARYLARASHLTQLRELVLSKCQLHSEALAELAKAPHLASLTHLDLSGNRIGPNGFAALLESPHLTNLRRLVVRGNPGAEGADGRRLIDRFGADVCEGVTA
jgi:Leucine-rich repeat (LRR) protein